MADFQLNNQEKSFLQALGRRPDGQRFAAILERAKQHYSSIDTIDPSHDQGAQVEGRKLFGKFADQMITTIKTQKHRTREIEHEDYT